MPNRIRELRCNLNLTQAELAKKIGLNQSAVGKYEREELEPNLDTLMKLSAIFECGIDYIIGYSDDFGNIHIPTQKNAELSPDAKELLNLFNSLDPLHQKQVLGYVQAFAKFSHPNKKRNLPFL